jgi:hypothetical protein
MALMRRVVSELSPFRRASISSLEDLDRWGPRLGFVRREWANRWSAGQLRRQFGPYDKETAPARANAV